MIAPLHLRVLLDQAQLKVIKNTKYTSWEDLRDRQTILQALKHYVTRQSTLSADASSFLCEFSNVRHRGNESAHTAAPGDIQNAILQSCPISNERQLLEQLFKFVYSEDV